jgi:hypothetical protein
MGRILLWVPRIHTEEEFMKLAITLPEDFESKTSEFWDYVEDKLNVFAGNPIC